MLTSLGATILSTICPFFHKKYFKIIFYDRVDEDDYVSIVYLNVFSGPKGSFISSRL